MSCTVTSKAFTLAELLIALAILGVIATFTIPKVLDSGGGQKHNAIANEVAGMISGALQSQKLNNGINSGTSVLDLLNYMNYVKIDTTTVIDLENTQGSQSCSFANRQCALMHNGGVLYYGTNITFGDTSTTSAIWMSVDPDGKYGGSTTGPSKTVAFWVYINGRIVTRGEIEPNTYCGGCGAAVNPVPARVPEYFSWGS